MPIVEFFTSDPGLQILASNTKINIIEQLAQAVRISAGRGSVGMYGAVVNDRGNVNNPIRLAGPEDLKSLYGGFKSWMGDGVTVGAAANYNDRGSLSGYEGNLAALLDGLDAPLITLTIPDFAVKDDVFDSGSDDDILVTFDRTGSTYGDYTLPAGTRISDGAGTPYILATLEDIFWAAADVGTKSVRVRQVSAPAVSAVAVNTVDVFIDSPDDTLVVVNTAAITVPHVSTGSAADIEARYLKAFTTSLTFFNGTIGELVVCDRTLQLVVDALFEHAEIASGQGIFRLAIGSPPLGTSASDAQSATTPGDGVGRTTLKRTYGAYVHQGWTRQFSADAANLNAEQGYQVDMPAAFSYAFNAALFRPEENPAQFTKNLTSYKVTGVEAISPLPDRKAHEDAGITQPVIEYANVGVNASLIPTFHASPLADGVIKFYTRRFAFFLYRALLAISQPYHKRLASPTNREALTDAIDDFLEQLLEAERIGGYNPTTSVWDGSSSMLTVNVAVKELGNIDVLTLRVVYGSDVETSRDLEAA